jgi:hypothetical protein
VPISLHLLVPSRIPSAALYRHHHRSWCYVLGRGARLLVSVWVRSMSFARMSVSRSRIDTKVATLVRMVQYGLRRILSLPEPLVVLWFRVVELACWCQRRPVECPPATTPSADSGGGTKVVALVHIAQYGLRRIQITPELLLVLRIRSQSSPAGVGVSPLDAPPPICHLPTRIGGFKADAPVGTAHRNIRCIQIALERLVVLCFRSRSS